MSERVKFWYIFVKFNNTPPLDSFFTPETGSYGTQSYILTRFPFWTGKKCQVCGRPNSPWRTLTRCTWKCGGHKTICGEGLWHCVSFIYILRLWQVWHQHFCTFFHHPIVRIPELLAIIGVSRRTCKDSYCKVESLTSQGNVTLLLSDLQY